MNAADRQAEVWTLFLFLLMHSGSHGSHGYSQLAKVNAYSDLYYLPARLPRKK